MSSRRSNPLAASITLIIVLVAGSTLVLPSACRVGGGHRMTESVWKAKQIKLCLDTFAMDFDGEYPNEKSARFFDFPPPKSSNDFFRQLHVTSNSDSERIHWVKDSPMCSEAKPDDVTSGGGEFDLTETLQPGDNHWAYFNGLKNTNNPALPIILDPYLPGTTSFDKNLWDGKVVLLRIDGSAKPEPLSRAGIILDEDGKNLLTTDSKVWTGATPDLRQPDPAP